MDKYQKVLLSVFQYDIYSDSSLEKSFRIDADASSDLSQISLDDAKIVVKQLENYNITKYYLRIFSPTFDSITYDGVEYKAKPDENGEFIIVELDFSQKVFSLTVNSSFIDSYTIPIEYIDADKEFYDNKVREIQKFELGKKINVSHKTGLDLVNIYWDLIDDSIDSVLIKLYVGDRLIAKYKETEAMFKSITGLAFGDYQYEIIELDSAGNEVAKSSKIKFSLISPNYGGKNTVTFTR